MYWHLNGDIVLCLVAKCLRSNLRNTRTADVVGRFGGDEFLAILHEVKLKDIPKIAKRVIDSVNKEVSEEFSKRIGREVKITISIGISVFQHDATDIKTLLEHADKAMAFAKHFLNKNSYHLYEKKLEKKKKYNFNIIPK